MSLSVPGVIFSVRTVVIYSDPQLVLAVKHSSSRTPLRPLSVLRSFSTNTAFTSYLFTFPSSSEAVLSIKLRSLVLDVPDEICGPCVGGKDLVKGGRWTLVIKDGEAVWRV
jgi:hypothetical protein